LLGWLCLHGPVAIGQTRSGPSLGAQPSGEPAQPSRRAAIRFVTANDFPPFNYFDQDGQLTGVNIDLARTVCSELAALCDIQVRPWDDLLTAVRRGEADAAIASHAVNARLLSEFAVSDRYYHTPARFAALRPRTDAEGREVVPRDPPDLPTTPAGLDGRRIGVVKGTAHEAYLRTFFTSSVVVPFDNAELARDAIRQRQVDLLFDDGISLVLWLNGEASKLCCELRGGPFVEPRYFGDGVGIVLARTDPTLKAQIDGALRRLRESGKIDGIFVRYFAIRPD
jgi:polar amino acid transport system substrate-binding protein